MAGGTNRSVTDAHIDAMRESDWWDTEADVLARSLVTIADELDGEGTEKTPRPTPTLVREQRLTLEALAAKGAASGSDPDAGDWTEDMPPAV